MSKKNFNETLVALRLGNLEQELSDELNNLVRSCTETGKVGELTLKIKLKPGKAGQIEVFDDVKVTLPKFERGSTIMFATPENNLQREDPRQMSLAGLKEVKPEKTPIRELPVKQA